METDTTKFPVVARLVGRGLPYAVALAVGWAMLIWCRGTTVYLPPKFGGIEPLLTQRAAEEILATGRTTMTYHATRYSYLVAMVYFLLPHEPIYVLYVQLALLPLVAWCIGRITGFLGGAPLERWGMWAAALYYPLGYCAATFTSIYPALVFTLLALVALVPLLGQRRSLSRSLLTGLALGVVVCTRPNFAFLGVVFLTALWRATGSLREALIRSLPIAGTSLALLATMTAVNPPVPGEFVRGSEAMGRNMLEGTYEYTRRWWDWDWMERPDDPAFHEFQEHLKRIEEETGKPAYDPASAPVVRREAWRRIFNDPANTLKKILISTVRVWVFIPTHLDSMTVKIACAVQEFLLLGLAVGGLFCLNPNGGRRVLASGVMAVPTITHWLLHVEPRYSLPGRGVELALAIVALAALARRLGARSLGLGLPQVQPAEASPQSSPSGPRPDSHSGQSL